MRSELSHRPTLASAIRRADEIVLAKLPITNDLPPERLSRFGDDLWDVGPAIFSQTARRRTHKVTFDKIDCPVERLTAKEYIFAWLNERLPDPVERLRPLQAQGALATLRRFMDFVRNREGRFSPGLIDQSLLDDWLTFQSARPIGRAQVAASLRPVYQLHRLAPFLTNGGLAFFPWNGRTAAMVAGCRANSSENLTPRIPEPVIGALLKWSLRYVDDFAPDILSAGAELDNLEAKARCRMRQPRKPDLVERTALWIEKRRAVGRGIPTWSAPNRMGGTCRARAQQRTPGGAVLNIQLIAAQIRAHPISLIHNKSVQRMLHGALAEFGAEPGGLDAPIGPLSETGSPWRERFDSQTLAHEERQLQTAAYILCSYLTGMRDGEVQAMQSGSLQLRRSPDGLTERIAVRSVVTKGRDAAGERAEWVTIAPVGRAIAVAEALVTRHRPEDLAKGSIGIWAVLHRAAAKDRGIPHIVRRLNEFRDHLDHQFGSPGNPAIPFVDGKPWVFNTRQFRRTVAWHIANRPFGVIAGKHQYKHASVAMFDGYAGASSSGFRQEVETERHLGQLEDIVSHYERRLRGEPLAGPSAARISAELGRIAHELGPLPGIVADTRRLKAMLGHLARTLYVGVLNDCFFERSAALCLSNVKDGQDVPRLSSCAPDRCPNSCISRAHLPPWQGAIARAEAIMDDKRLSKLQRNVIRQDRDRMRKLIAPLIEGTPE